MPAVHHLPYIPPYDWASVLGFLRLRAISGIERVDGDTWQRTFVLGGIEGVVKVSAGDGPFLCVHCEPRLAGPALADLTARVVRVFDLDFDPVAANAHLARDPRLAPLVAARPGLRVPGAWEPFETAVRAVLGQQISVTAAVALAARLVEQHGTPLQRPVAGLSHRFPQPSDMLDVDPGRMRMPGARARTLCALATAVAADPSLLAEGQPLDRIVSRLLAIRGIGEWTAQYIALRALRHPDAFPASDIGLLRAFADGQGNRPSPRALAEHAEGWRPWRGRAAQHLWTAG